MKINLQQYSDDKQGLVRDNINNYCKSDIEIRKRKKQVNIIASHLINAFRIESYKTHLVLALCNGVKDNNIEAVKYWVDSKLDIIGIDDYVLWNSALEEHLNNIYV